MTHHLLHWEAVLKRAGHRATKQRGVILDAVCAANGHTLFDEIYARTRQLDRSVDRSTVYRALHLFVELGLVVEAKEIGETRFEIRKVRPYRHLVCRACGEERVVSDDTIHTLVDHIFELHRFSVSTDHLVLYDICDSCVVRDAESLACRGNIAAARIDQTNKPG